MNLNIYFPLNYFISNNFSSSSHLTFNHANFSRLKINFFDYDHFPYLRSEKRISMMFFLKTVKKATSRFRFYTIFAFCSSVKTDMGASGAISRLYIANANKKDSGNYSCALADVAAATTVSVHVLNGTFVYRAFDYIQIKCVFVPIACLFMFFFFFCNWSSTYAWVWCVNLRDTCLRKWWPF